MERSNNTIKNLSLSMYGVINFYKDLIDASKVINDNSMISNKSEQIFDIINKA